MSVKQDRKNIACLLNNMTLIRQLGVAVSVSISLCLVFSQAAYASTVVGISDQTAHPYYIDAGTAGLIIQGLVGGLAAGLAMAVVFRRRLTYWVKSKLKRSGDSEDEEDTEDVLPTETKDESGE